MNAKIITELSFVYLALISLLLTIGCSTPYYAQKDIAERTVTNFEVVGRLSTNTMSRAEAIDVIRRYFEKKHSSKSYAGSNFEVDHFRLKVYDKFDLGWYQSSTELNVLWKSVTNIEITESIREDGQKKFQIRIFFPVMKDGRSVNESYSFLFMDEFSNEPNAWNMIAALESVTGFFRRSS